MTWMSANFQFDKIISNTDMTLNVLKIMQNRRVWLLALQLNGPRQHGMPPAAAPKFLQGVKTAMPKP